MRAEGAEFAEKKAKEEMKFAIAKGKY